jgi:hypothetical protein
MSRSRWIAVVVSCALLSIGSACGGDDEGDGDSGGGGAGAAAPRAGAGAGGGGAGMAAAGMGGAGMGAGGMGSAPNMPDAMCLSMASAETPCSRCACTPNAMGGCLDELSACQGSTDAMAAMLCGAIIACAEENGCSGAACVTPCMAEITAASGYMMGAPLTAATAVGTCTGMSCDGACGM